MTENRNYTTGIMPVNPIIRDVVYIISDIRSEPNREEDNNPTETYWSYVVDEVVTLQDYIGRMKANFDQTALEIDQAMFELDAGGV